MCNLKEPKGYEWGPNQVFMLIVLFYCYLLSSKYIINIGGNIMSRNMMKRAVLYKPGDLRIEEVPIPVPGPGEVVIRIR